MFYILSFITQIHTRTAIRYIAFLERCKASKEKKVKSFRFPPETKNNRRKSDGERRKKKVSKDPNAAPKRSIAPESEPFLQRQIGMPPRRTKRFGRNELGPGGKTKAKRAAVGSAPRRSLLLPSPKEKGKKNLK